MKSTLAKKEGEGEGAEERTGGRERERGGERKRNIKSLKYKGKSLFIERHDPIDILR